MSALIQPPAAEVGPDLGLVTLDAAQQLRILVVDDTPAIHDDITAILTPQGGEIAANMNQAEADFFGDTPPKQTAATTELSYAPLTHAFQGEEAVGLAATALEAKAPFALAFVDMRMPPGIDGLQTIQQLWQVDPHMQVVICTAYSDHSHADITQALGTSDQLVILKKPFDPIEIAQIAQTLTAKWRSENQVRTLIANLEATVQARTASLEKANACLKDEMAERARLEKDLRMAQKLEAIGQLSAGIAHEVNTPIQFVSDSISYLLEASRTLDPQALQAKIPEACAVAQRGVDRVAAIVKAMREFSHPGGGEFNDANLADIIRDALTVGASALKQVATVETALADMPPIRCDRALLGQAILNLLVNAAHAMEEKQAEESRQSNAAHPVRVPGTLRVTSGLDQANHDWVWFAISDTGCGIPESIQDRIFDPFFTTKDVGKGTGQGLAMLRNVIVSKHQGRVALESKVGVGTTFTISLPIEGRSTT